MMNDDSYKPLDRRPIASRDIGLFQTMAAWLAAKNVSPNAISFLSVVFGAAAGGALAATSYTEGWTTRILWITSAAMIQLRLIANMLDGMVAINSGKASPVGELYNEAPDRVSDAAILVGAGYAAGGNVTLGFAAALLAVGVAYVRALGASAGAGQAFIGPMAKPQRMFVMTVTALYCGLAPTAWQPVCPVNGWSIVTIALIGISLGCLITMVRRLKHIATTLREKHS
jgi:phosphatidylglycerophosphate synthase